MSDDEPGKRKAAGIVGIFVLFTALVNLICGFIYVGLVGGADASGIWSGIGVSELIFFFLYTRVNVLRSIPESE